jgi:hypothetical protein
MTKILPNYITEEFYIQKPRYIIIEKSDVAKTISIEYNWGEYIYNIFFNILYKH